MKYIVAILCSIILLSCDNSLRVVGGECIDCEAVIEYNKKKLRPVDTMVTYKRKDKPALKLYGKVYESDGITPASKALVYIYHTNIHGEYETAPFLNGWGKTHGIVRGWAKTNETGEYGFLTILPTYHKDSMSPRTIHMYVKEKSSVPYRLDNLYFADDPRLTNDIIENQEGKGGESILYPTQNNGIIEVRKDIILGKNISNYTPPS